MIKVNGLETPIFKDPKTDDGTKKSALGRVEVYRGPTGNLYFADENTKSPTGPSDHEIDLLTTLFKDGKLIKETSLSEIKNRIDG